MSAPETSIWGVSRYKLADAKYRTVIFFCSLPIFSKRRKQVTSCQRDAAIGACKIIKILRSWTR